MKSRLLMGAAVMLLAGGVAQAQTLSGEALVRALRQGGYVIVMRHTSSPREVPDKKTANPDNVKPERQLDEEGRTTATAMGKALHELKIPIGEVFTSPTYRALETVKYAQLGTPRPVPELGDNGQSMQGGTEAQAVWLRNAVKQFHAGTFKELARTTEPGSAEGSGVPGGLGGRAGPVRTNTILVTHFPNIRGAFPELTDVADGEALVFGPDGKGGATLVGRIKIEEWPGLR